MTTALRLAAVLAVVILLVLAAPYLWAVWAYLDMVLTRVPDYLGR